MGTRPQGGGVYEAHRAAALSGVPKTTIYNWARSGYLIPSVSEFKPMLWSFHDLLGLRLIYWFRQAKDLPERDIVVPPSKLQTVVAAIRQIQKVGFDAFDTHVKPRVFATISGDVIKVLPNEPPTNPDGQQTLLIDLVEPLSTKLTKGPDLWAPAPNLRIIPRKLSGAPHIEATRVPTETLYALWNRGMVEHQILDLYPMINRESLEESLDLEDQLARNALAEDAA